MVGKDKCIVTIMNTLSETSMAFNEFVLYRSKNYPAIKQVVIVCSLFKPDSIKEIPENIDLHFVGMNLFKIRQILNNVSKHCKENGIPMIIHIHYPKSGLIFHFASIYSKYNKKVLFTVHSTFKSRNIKYKFTSLLNSLLAHRITIVSNTAYDSYPLWMKKIKGGNLVSIPNGVDLERIDSIIKCLEKDKKETDVKTLVYVARMAPFKNHLFLLKVLKNIRNYKLVLIGLEDKEGRVREFITNHHLDNHVEFTGLIPRNEVFARLKQADIYLSPSLVEGLPISALEAMYTGLPIIMSDIGPHKEIGYYSEYIQTLPLDEHKWITVLQEYIDMNRDSLEAIGLECRQCAKRNYSLMSMHQQYDIIYNSLTKEG